MTKNYSILISCLCLISINLLGASEVIKKSDPVINIIKSPFEVPGVAIDGNVSSVIRIICYENKIIAMASNKKGSDFIDLNQECDLNKVVEYSLIYSKNINSNSSGIFRTINLYNKDFIIYSPKGNPPSIMLLN
jgi:hypothetical protein